MPTEKVKLLTEYVSMLHDFGNDFRRTYEALLAKNNYTDELMQKMKPAMEGLATYLNTDSLPKNRRACLALKPTYLAQNPEYINNELDEHGKNIIEVSVVDDPVYGILNSMPEDQAIWYAIQYLADTSSEMREFMSKVNAAKTAINIESSDTIDGGTVFIKSLFASRTSSEGSPANNLKQSSKEYIDKCQIRIDETVIDVPDSLNEDIVILANIGNFLNDDLMRDVFEKQRSLPGSTLFATDAASSAKGNFYDNILKNDERTNMQYPREFIPDIRKETIRQINVFKEGNRIDLGKALTSAFTNSLEQCMSTEKHDHPSFSFPAQMLKKCITLIQDPKYRDLFSVTEKDVELAKAFTSSYDMLAVKGQKYSDLSETFKDIILNPENNKKLKSRPDLQDSILDVMVSDLYRRCLGQQVKSIREYGKYNYEKYLSINEGNFERHLMYSDLVNALPENRELTEFEKMNAEDHDAFMKAMKDYLRTTPNWKDGCNKPVSEILGNIVGSFALESMLREFKTDPVLAEKEFIKNFSGFLKELAQKERAAITNPKDKSYLDVIKAVDDLEKQRAKLPENFTPADVFKLKGSYEKLLSAINKPQYEKVYRSHSQELNRYINGLNGAAKYEKMMAKVRKSYQAERAKTSPVISEEEKALAELKNTVKDTLKSNIEYAQFKLDATLRSREQGKIDTATAEKNIRSCIAAIITNAAISEKVDLAKGEFAENEINVLGNEDMIKQQRKALMKSPVFDSFMKSLKENEIKDVAMSKSANGEPEFSAVKVNKLYRKMISAAANPKAAAKDDRLIDEPQNSNGAVSI